MFIGRRQLPKIFGSIRRKGQPARRRIQKAAEDPHCQVEGGRGSRRVRREDSQETAEGSRQARR